MRGGQEEEKEYDDKGCDEVAASLFYTSRSFIPLYNTLCTLHITDCIGFSMCYHIAYSNKKKKKKINQLFLFLNQFLTKT